MKKLLLLIAVPLLSTAAAAQRQWNTKQECTRLCLAEELDNPEMQRYAQKLKEIRDKKEKETDPAKRKALEQAESDQIDLRRNVQESDCKYICAPLRDE
jgi:hypothetical protein